MSATSAARTSGGRTSQVYVSISSSRQAPGTFAITWSDGPQVSVDGAQTVTVPYSNMVMLGRTLAGDATDQQQAIALMKQFSDSNKRNDK